MGGGVIGIGLQRGLVMRACLGMAVGAEQEVAEVHLRHRVLGMMQDRFRIDAAGGVDRALGGEPRSEFVERAEMGRMPAEKFDECRLRVGLSVERAKQRRALDFDRVYPARFQICRQAGDRARATALPARGEGPSGAGRLVWFAAGSRAERRHAGFEAGSAPHYRLIRRWNAGLKSKADQIIVILL